MAQIHYLKQAGHLSLAQVVVRLAAILLGID
jgi:hypothetical protein